jgi:hypothetical protein
MGVHSTGVTPTLVPLSPAVARVWITLQLLVSHEQVLPTCPSCHRLGSQNNPHKPWPAAPSQPVRTPATAAAHAQSAAAAAASKRRQTHAAVRRMRQQRPSWCWRRGWYQEEQTLLHDSSSRSRRLSAGAQHPPNTQVIP